jgi:hypothetical protein
VTRRRLPHIYAENAWLFVTWCLHGSLPPNRYPPPGVVTAGQAFVHMDRYLDTTIHGPQFLKIPAAAQLVVDAIQSETGFQQAHSSS